MPSFPLGLFIVILKTLDSIALAVVPAEACIPWTYSVFFSTDDIFCFFLMINLVSSSKYYSILSLNLNRVRFFLAFFASF